MIRPYDAGTIKDIEKAIVAGDLGLNPQSDGRIVRLNVPPLSTEVRKKMVSRIKELAEEAKISIRNIRRDANKAADASSTDGSFAHCAPRLVQWDAGNSIPAFPIFSRHVPDGIGFPFRV